MSVLTEHVTRGRRHAVPSPMAFPALSKRTVLSPSPSANVPSVLVKAPPDVLSAFDKVVAKPRGRTSTPVSITRSSTPQIKKGTDDQRFTELVNELQEMHLRGISKPNGTQVAAALVRANPKFYASKGFARWKDFSLAAQSLGVVDMGGDPLKPGAQWISLRNAPQPKVDPLTTKATKGTPLEPFTRLLDILREMTNKGIPCPELGVVARVLLQRDPKFYMAGGFDSWIEFVHAAESLGLVEVGLDLGTQGVLCISLGTSNGEKSRPSAAKQGPKYLPYRGPFWELVETLRRFQEEGSDKPYRLAVAARLVRAYPDIYKSSGFAHWADYVSAAATHSLVKLGGSGTAGLWISLL